MPIRVFISYARDSGDAEARRLRDELLVEFGDDLLVWFDGSSIPLGTRWNPGIERGLAEADALLVLLTKDAGLRAEVEAEWRRALQLGKPVVSLLYPDASVPYRLDTQQNLEIAKGRPAAMARLRLWLRGLIDASPASAAAPSGPAAAAPSSPAQVAATLEEVRRQQLTQSTVPRATGRSRVAGTPPDVGVSHHFRGREREVTELGRLIAAPAARLVTVLGRAGIGKTALACRVLGDLERHQWPEGIAGPAVDGIVYLSTRSPGGLNLDRLLAACSQLLGQAGYSVLESSSLSVEAKIANLLDLLSHGVYVVLLDHFEDLLDADGRLQDPGLRACFEAYLRTPLEVRLLITSREPLHFAPEVRRFNQQLSLDRGLDDEAGVLMLRDLDLNGTAGLRDAPDDQLMRAVRQAHGLPRALQILAGILEDERPVTTLDDLLQRFHEHGGIEDTLMREGYERLGPDAQMVLQALAVLRQPVPAVAVEFMLQPFAPGLDVRRILQRLFRAQMVVAQAPIPPPVTAAGHAPTPGPRERIALHPIDEDYAYRSLPADGPWTRVSAERRAAEYFRALRLPPERWLTREGLDPMLTEFDHLVRAGAFDEAAAVLEEVEFDYLFNAGRAQRACEMRQQLVERVTEPRLLARQLHALGRASIFLGDIEAGRRHLAQAIGMARDLGERAVEAEASGWLGESSRRLGRFQEAASLTDEAVRIFNELGQGAKEARWLCESSLLASYVGDVGRAVADASRALAMALETSAAVTIALAHDSLALAWLVAGRCDMAVEQGNLALAAYKGSSWESTSMYVRNVLGLAHVCLGRVDEGVEHLQAAGRMARDDHDARVQGLVHFNLARVYRQRGDRDAAARETDAAVHVLGRMGAVELRAAQELRHACDAEAAGARQNAARALVACARASLESPDVLDPADLLAEARAIAATEGAEDLAREAEDLLARIAARQAPFDQASA
jgi:tetratricopeptide (TPR) repeat protein